MSSVFRSRLISTVSLWLLVGLTVFASKAWAYLLLVGILLMLAVKEYFDMLYQANVKAGKTLGLTTAFFYSLWLYYYFINQAEVGFGRIEVPAGADGLAIFLVLAFAFFRQLRRPIKGVDALLAVAANVMGFIYLAFHFNFIARILFYMPGRLDSEVPGAWYVLWLIIVTKFTDMGAYLVGSWLGKDRMIPHISPSKTWQGFAGALFFAVFGACGLYAVLPNQLNLFQGWSHVIILG